MQHKAKPYPKPIEEKNIKEKISGSSAILWGILILYALVSFYSLVFHEPWRDEAQSWLLVRDLSMFDLLKALRNEVHPPLWYLLTMPLANAGLPYISQHILSICLMVLAVYLFLFKLSLSIWLKVLIPFSYFFFYEYSVFARNYSLAALMLVSVLYLYPVRFNKPLLYALSIVGLFNAHILAFGFCCALVALYGYEVLRLKHKDSRYITAIIVMVVGGLYLLPYMGSAGLDSGYEAAIVDNTSAITDALSFSVIAMNNIAGVVLFIVLLGILLQYPSVLLVVLAGAAGLLYAIGFKITGGPRHQGILFLILVAGYALAEYYKNKDDKPQARNYLAYGAYLLGLSIVIQLKTGIERYVDDVNNTYSGARDAATFIKEHDLDNKTIIAHQAWGGAAVAPYLPGKKMFYPECECMGTFYDFGETYRAGKWQYAVDFAVDDAYKNYKGKLDDVVLLFNYPVMPKAMRFLDLVYESEEIPICNTEAYYIYKFKDGVK